MKPIEPMDCLCRRPPQVLKDGVEWYVACPHCSIYTLLRASRLSAVKLWNTFIKRGR